MSNYMAKGAGKVKRKRKLFKYVSTGEKTVLVKVGDSGEKKEVKKRTNYFKVRKFTKEFSKPSDFPKMRMFDPVIKKHVEFYAARLDK